MRSTSNGNANGSSADRRRRREWLVEHYRADVDVVIRPWDLDDDGTLLGYTTIGLGEGMPACRCYRCGTLLTVDTVTVDRRVPGCEGGTYRRDNIRPACGSCNSSTGGKLGAARRAKAREAIAS